MEKIINSAFLYSDHNGANKVYNAFLVEVEGGFMVTYQNGAKGSTLTAGKKTKAPVDLAAAQKVFEKLVKEKKNGSSHYRDIDANPDAYVAPVDGKVPTGLNLMFPSAIKEEADVETYLKSPLYVMQEKFDGEHFANTDKDGDLVGSNKLGFERGVPNDLKSALEASLDSHLNGELIGSKLYVFDILQFNGKDMLSTRYDDRILSMEKAVAQIANPLVVAVQTYRTEQEKREAFAAIKARGGEGVIFKRIDASYVPGKGKETLKYKFTESATLVVLSITQGKASVRVAGYDAKGTLVPMGNVTIPSNHAMPAVDSIVEVEYLYAYSGTHKLAQPVYKGLRNDQDLSSCVLSQLKYKTPLDIDDEDAEGDSPNA